MKYLHNGISLNRTLLCMIFCVLGCHGDELVTFCAMYGNESNEYSLHLKNGGLLNVDSNWKFPDSILCEVSLGKPILNESYQLMAPVDDDSVDKAEACFCSSFNTIPSHTEWCFNLKIDSVSINPTSRADLRFFKMDARNTLPAFYGKKFKGKWEAKFQGTTYTYSKSFDAVVVGSCNSKNLIAEYCIEKRNLHLERELDYIPQHLFRGDDECDLCGDEYRESLTTSVNYGNGKFVPTKDILDKDCDDYVPKESFELPQSVKNVKSLYRKTLLVRIDAEIQNGGNLRKDSYEFNIRINGPCE